MWDIDIIKGLEKLNEQVFKDNHGCLSRVYEIYGAIIFELTSNKIFQYDHNTDTLTEIV